MITMRNALTLLSSAGLVATLGCKDMKDESSTAPSGGVKIADKAPAPPSDSKPTIPATKAIANAGPLFARTELRPIESNDSPKMTGNVELYGSPAAATMKLWVTNLSAGTYGVYLGKDCLPAGEMHDTNAADSKGVGSATIRKDEMKLGDLVVDKSGQAELTAAVPYNYADAPPLTDMAVILMPISAEKMDHPQTKVACGDINGVPVGS